MTALEEYAAADTLTFEQALDLLARMAGELRAALGAIDEEKAKGGGE